MTEALPQKRRKPPGRPGGFRGNPLKLRLYLQIGNETELRLRALRAGRKGSLAGLGRAAEVCRNTNGIQKCVHDPSQFTDLETTVKRILEFE